MSPPPTAQPQASSTHEGCGGNAGFPPRRGAAAGLAGAVDDCFTAPNQEAHQITFVLLLYLIFLLLLATNLDTLMAVQAPIVDSFVSMLTD